MSDDTTRRAFLRVAAAVLGGALTGVGGACERDGRSARAEPRPPGRPIGVQLYTLRTLMERDVESTLASVADIGYREVEFAGYFDRDPRQLRATLDRLQLTAPSAHQGLPELRTKLDAVLDMAQALGHAYVLCPSVPEEERTLAGYRKLAGEFNRWGLACRERGLRFAYHNHDFEFAEIEGSVPYDVLLEETDPALVAMELDLFWITKAGHDPLTYFERHRGRFPLWHVKDMRGLRDAQEMVTVGEGDIDFGRIFTRSEQAGLEHFYVEHDEPADPLASVRTSYDHLRRLLS